MTREKGKAEAAPETSLRRLRRWLIVVCIVYFFAGNVSQRMVPGVDEIFPFFGWSLFTKVPNLSERYAIVISAHDGQAIDPPVAFLSAPPTIVTGNRYIARKVINHLGEAFDRGDAAEVERLRRLVETNYMLGEVRYELVFERFQALEKWQTGADRERRGLAQFSSGAP